MFCSTNRPKPKAIQVTIEWQQKAANPHIPGAGTSKYVNFVVVKGDICKCLVLSDKQPETQRYSVCCHILKEHTKYPKYRQPELSNVWHFKLEKWLKQWIDYQNICWLLFNWSNKIVKVAPKGQTSTCKYWKVSWLGFSVTDNLTDSIWMVWMHPCSSKSR